VDNRIDGRTDAALDPQLAAGALVGLTAHITRAHVIMRDSGGCGVLACGYAPIFRELKCAR